MNKKIAIITSGHSPYDERLLHKFGRTFVNNSYQVNILSSTLEINKIENEINLNGFDGINLPKKDKIFKFYEILCEIQPDIIICCEPLTILPSYKYRKQVNNKAKIISDITEWYPGHAVLNKPGLKKYFEFLRLFIFNIYATNLVDKLIIGEKRKKKRYDLIAPFKSKTIIGYYPVLEYFNYNEPPFDKKHITLGYAGLITFERGILTLLDTAVILSQLHNELKIRLKIIGRFGNLEEENIFYKKIQNISSIEIIMVEWGDYRDISKKLSDVDICFDLRCLNFVYRNSLPIKIFEYMACGKPVIYSNAKVIRQELPVKRFGFLVNPKNKEQILESISKYINDPFLLQKHSFEARWLVETYYNWESLEGKLLAFIEH